MSSLINILTLIILQYRIESGREPGHVFGNIEIAVMKKANYQDSRSDVRSVESRINYIARAPYFTHI